MKHDDSEIYFLNFEADLPNENGGRHIALFLEWAIQRGLANGELTAEADNLRSGKTTGLDLLFDRCDGKLYTDDLNDEGNAFVVACYHDYYIPDFIAAMNVPPDARLVDIYGADLTLQRRRRVAWQLDRRYADWLCASGQLPDKEALSERVMAVIRPVAEASGFAFTDNGSWGSHSVHRHFGRKGLWGSHGFTVVSDVSPNSFYGVHVDFSVDVPALSKAIYHEKTLDRGNVSAVQPAARIPFEVFAEGWNGPLQDYNLNAAGFWIFRDADIEPLAQWLAERLRRFALPLLKNLDGIDGLALEYCKRPLSASRILDLGDVYGALLAVEMARHPKLGTFLDDVERMLRPLGDAMSQSQHGALALIGRIRSRSRALL
jgi:hypothetical protein